MDLLHGHTVKVTLQPPAPPPTPPLRLPPPVPFALDFSLRYKLDLCHEFILSIARVFQRRSKAQRV